MKKDDIKVGGRYTAKVSGSVVPVRITGERWVNDEHRGWNAVNTATNRPVVIKSAQRLRAEILDAAPGGEPAKVEPGANPPAPDATAANVAPQRAARAIRVIGAKPVPAVPLAEGLKNWEGAKENARSWENLPDHGNADGSGKQATKGPSAGSPVPRKAKSAKGAKAKAPKPKADKPKRMSGLDACAKVLDAAGKPMGAKDMVEKAIEKGLWKSGGKTPEATIYAAIIRDIAARGKESRFKKVDRGLFSFNGSR